MEKKYENVELEIILFGTDDIVTASCPDVQPDSPVDCEWFTGPH